VTFGVDTAVSIATEALDRLHTTAESHERVLVVEVMGRHAGWIALHSGLAGGADVILIPEIPYDIDAVCAKINNRQAHGIPFSIVVVAEGALPRDGQATVKHSGVPGGVERLGGVSETIASAIHNGTGKETRTLTLGHLLRGGSPTTFDRLLGVRFGAAAVRAAERKEFGNMVALSGQDITTRPIKDGIGFLKTVPLDGDTVQTARDLGVCLGDV
jgi:6-phosphofructokinase